MTATFIILTMIKAVFVIAQGGIVIAHWGNSKELMRYLPVIILLGVLSFSIQIFINEEILLK